MSSTRLLLRRAGAFRPGVACAGPTRARLYPTPPRARLSPPPCCPGATAEEQHLGARAPPSGERLGGEGSGACGLSLAPRGKARRAPGPQRKEPGVEQEDDEFRGRRGRIGRPSPPAAPRYPHQGAATTSATAGEATASTWAGPPPSAASRRLRAGPRVVPHRVTQGRWAQRLQERGRTSKRDGTAVPVGGDAMTPLLRSQSALAHTGSEP